MAKQETWVERISREITNLGQLFRRKKWIGVFVSIILASAIGFYVWSHWPASEKPTPSPDKTDPSPASSIQIFVEDRLTGKGVEGATLRSENIHLIASAGGLTNRIPVQEGMEIEVSHRGYQSKSVVITSKDIQEGAKTIILNPISGGTEHESR